MNTNEAEQQSCCDADGCPQELAVLKRYWHDSQATAALLRYEREELIAALRDLLHEVNAAGLGDAKDYGWPDAIAAARAALADAEVA